MSELCDASLDGGVIARHTTTCSFDAFPHTSDAAAVDALTPLAFGAAPDPSAA